jgi:AbrB family looped-hinge helix DNA binding protein
MKTLTKESVRVVDCLGRVHLPKEVRQELNLQENDRLEVMVVLGNVVLTKVRRKCPARKKLNGQDRCSAPFSDGDCDYCNERVKTNYGYNCEDESTGESYSSLKGFGE